MERARAHPDWQPSCVCLRWRTRRKIRACGPIKDFLDECRRKASFGKAIRSYYYNTVKLQRRWRDHSRMLVAQRGVLLLQVRHC